MMDDFVPELPQCESSSLPKKEIPSLPPAAQRALAEAALRRAAQQTREQQLAAQQEHKGRGGHDPVRYQDWEIKGLAVDF